MTRSFVEVAITADSRLMEPLVGLLSQLGFEGFWEDGAVLKGYISAGRWDEGMKDEVDSLVRNLVQTSSSPLPHISVHSLEDQNWNEAWEKTIRPIRVTDRIVIRPTWHSYDATPGEIVLTIDPKMSFGTGYHESTRLVLRLLEKHIRPGARVLDVGTGTGVLAIAAIKLGASSAVGVDVDEWSYTNALENARLNAVEDRITIQAGHLSDAPSGMFDMILANIQWNVIAPLLGEMDHRLSPGGSLILSGLLLADREDICSAVDAAHLTIIEEMVENEWIAFMCQAR